MKKLIIAAASLSVLTSAALADSKPSAEEAAKINEALKAWGCSGGEVEKETEGTGVFEIDDAKCAGGQYDIKLDANYGVTSMTRD